MGRLLALSCVLPSGTGLRLQGRRVVGQPARKNAGANSVPAAVRCAVAVERDAVKVLEQRLSTDVTSAAQPADVASTSASQPRQQRRRRQQRQQLQQQQQQSQASSPLPASLRIVPKHQQDVVNEAIEVKEDTQVAVSQPPPPPQQQQNSSNDTAKGDPLGRKRIGSAVVRWLARGTRQCARAVIDSVNNGELDADDEFDLLSTVQPFLDKCEMPPDTGNCQLARWHLPTIWDHFQRETMALLRDMESELPLVDEEKDSKASDEDDSLPLWQRSLAWAFVKDLPQREFHKQVARDRTPAPEPLMAIQQRIEEYVDNALQLLKFERDSEVAVTQQLLGETPLDGLPLDVDETLDRDRNDTIDSLIVVNTASGLNNAQLLTLRRLQGGALPESTVQPGDVVMLRCEAPLNEEDDANDFCIELQCNVHRLGESGNSITVSVEQALGDVVDHVFGQVLRLTRLRSLANDITYERNCSALERLRRAGLRNSPAKAAVKTLFGQDPLVLPKGGEKLFSSESSEKSKKNFLEKSQREAVAFALDATLPVAVIQGPPGTGKTTVVTDIVERAVQRGERVLASAASNAAIDNLVDKLADKGLKVVRLGNPTRFSANVAARSLSNLLDGKLYDFRKEYYRVREQLRQELAYTRNPEQHQDLRMRLRRLSRLAQKEEKNAATSLLAEAQVVLCTNTGAADPLLQKQPTFDMVVIDEAGQATEPSTWIALLHGRRAVLVGDTCQLAPTVISRDAVAGGLNTSLMERAASLHNGALTRMLRTQYRMHPHIALWASNEMYNGRLQSAYFLNGRVLSKRPHVTRTPDTETPMLLLDTRTVTGIIPDSCLEMLEMSGSFHNEGEAHIVARHVQDLMAAGVPATSIAVASPYNAQVELLKQRLALVPGCNAVEVTSIDSFQGREADAVIISMVRSNDKGAVGFLADARRMNVAITRARMHVAVVCDTKTVTKHPFLRRLVQHIKSYGCTRSAHEVAEVMTISPPVPIEQRGAVSA
eukprot:jgi/Chlat1/2310/Chrsp17S02598